MVINDAGCCAVEEITELAEYIGRPATAMKEFCRNFLGFGGKFNREGIYAFYIFTGVERGLKTEQGYGSQFAGYIRKHKLGDVIVTKGEYNRVNHPTHLVKVWVWRPDVDSLESWFKTHYTKADKEDYESDYGY